jgi:hypothetical protein
MSKKSNDIINRDNMKICKRIFPVTEDGEFKTIEKFQEWLETICKIKRSGKFHLRSKTGLGDGCNSPGSLWIFRLKGHLIGEGEVEKDITDNDDKAPEKYAICFKPNTIKLYSKPIPVKDITLPSGKDIIRRGITLSPEDYEYLKDILEK